ncbi:DUF2183 domain-containing protein [Sulfidibacter corallicola]|uniref:DUF2183 domain-containing protein n=1 Tax=Sulfidibacter corallicola TaxID=2818388 RepID=A0A8A4THF3_SULCO|nr:phosphatase domain-containing protein [Sulfidibacter corallicola]QTD49356.1 DUF2183 domain-containing protein [Sulfidibacter corallicola]
MLIYCWLLLALHPSIASDEEIVFFPSLAKQSAEGTWQAQVHGWIFEPEFDSRTRRALAASLRKALGDLTDSEARLFEERMRWFLVDNERGKRITILLGEHQFTLDKSDASGHFHGEMTLPEKSPDSFAAVTSPRDTRLFRGRLHRVSDGGWAVVSDIDDTIKISGVLDKRELLINTFCRPFAPTPGLAEIYRQWAARDASFFYVSASPWQLYPDLAEFIRSNRFPLGVFFLRPLRVKDRTFYHFLFEDKIAYKRERILNLYRDFPTKKFLLVGDSGEKDPEVYGEIAARYPKRTLAILIRQVREKPDPDRLSDLAKRVAPIPVVVFREHEELAGFDPLQSTPSKD